MREYVWDFLVVESGNTPIFSKSVDVDIAGYNTIIIVNITLKPIFVPYPGGVGLGFLQRVTINGNELENYAGKITILWDDISPPNVGQALFIRKKFIS